jgi:hypothetical protein
MPRAPALRLLGAALVLASAPLPAQSPTLLRLRNAASADRLVVDSAGGMVVSGNSSQGTIPASGEGVRMMWYPSKAAFRAGYVGSTHWNDTNVGNYSTAMGASTTASGEISTALGLLTTASGGVSTAMGWATTASGNYSTALGSNTTASGNYSTASGAYASTAGFTGSFVYGDNSTTAALNADDANQVSFRAAGGYRLFTTSAMTIGAVLSPGQTSWSTLSDRHRKTALLPVDGEDVLSRIRRLPVSTWIYTDQPDATVRHMGPMAQDWHRAFGFSADSLTINSADFDGVNLAGVQALTARTDALREENARLADALRGVREENAALRRSVEALERRSARLESLVGRLEAGGDTQAP